MTKLLNPNDTNKIGYFFIHLLLPTHYRRRRLRHQNVSEDNYNCPVGLIQMLLRYCRLFQWALRVIGHGVFSFERYCGTLSSFWLMRDTNLGIWNMLVFGITITLSQIFVQSIENAFSDPALTLPCPRLYQGMQCAGRSVHICNNDLW
jgi:hypothetical protein